MSLIQQQRVGVDHYYNSSHRIQMMGDTSRRLSNNHPKIQPKNLFLQAPRGRDQTRWGYRTEGGTKRWFDDKYTCPFKGERSATREGVFVDRIAAFEASRKRGTSSKHHRNIIELRLRARKTRMGIDCDTWDKLLSPGTGPAMDGNTASEDGGSNLLRRPS
ncbi:hypothetical protein BO94DRAFT_46636 [Aspergillus sclerotioniger CBS 115572]|uniref:Uncharacterized protein n=1 Tax=Aspergillus sclerotioniger CBS 115572 TaxID=1450535 RepID=A0A317WTY7_9EURO|nr:hypothetical protein BO94DRAFT_46636 [Aspergillus sclerotioniger CBS 115572]PWY88647.1 hypothetical protein BO94DRAFT_46636 [Aspergillus sclerotioniger CBS 115572]